MIIYPTLQSLATEAINHYHADPARVERALLICERGKWDISRAQWDELGMPVKWIDQDVPDLVIVRSSGGRGWYYVRPRARTCSCRDSQQHNICKHRIAVWIWYELIKRSTTYVPTKSLCAPPAAS